MQLANQSRGDPIRRCHAVDLRGADASALFTKPWLRCLPGALCAAVAALMTAIYEDRQCAAVLAMRRACSSSPGRLRALDTASGTGNVRSSLTADGARRWACATSVGAMRYGGCALGCGAWSR